MCPLAVRLALRVRPKPVEGKSKGHGSLRPQQPQPGRHGRGRIGAGRFCDLCPARVPLRGLPAAGDGLPGVRWVVRVFARVILSSRRCAVSGRPGRSFVGFLGSPSPLPAGAAPFVAQVVPSVVRAGCGVAVGCSVGGGAVAFSARLALPLVPGSSGPELVVFAAFGPRGEGAWGGSAVTLVQRAAGLVRSPGHGLFSPVSVAFWLRGKLTRRARRMAAQSAALVRFAAASGRHRAVVAFVVGGWSSSPGSWATLRLAVLARVPVVVFPCVPVSGTSECRWGFSAARVAFGLYLPLRAGVVPAAGL